MKPKSLINVLLDTANQLNKLDDMHQNKNNRCTYCGQFWPCKTHQIIHPQETHRDR